MDANPLNGKRMQTFFNEFLVTTISFLNKFAEETEEKFYNFDRKLNKIESNLLIVESKLASIPSIEEKPTVEQKSVSVLPDVESLKAAETGAETKEQTPENFEKEVQPPVPEAIQPEDEPDSEPQPTNKIKISDSKLYGRYFKMLKFGIPAQAVRIKMSSEEVDPTLLDNPDMLIEKTPDDEED